MKRTSRLFNKLKVETIGDLKRMRGQMVVKSLNGLIAEMIKLTDAHRTKVKDLLLSNE